MAFTRKHGVSDSNALSGSVASAVRPDIYGAGVRSARRSKELMIFGTTVRNKRHGAEESSGQDCMGGYTRWPEAYLVTLTDRCSFLCVSGQRGTIAKSMHEDHLCVVALTSMERGTQFFPLASYRLV